MQQIKPGILHLIANFQEKKTSGELLEDGRCAYGTNGGFYIPEHLPLGLFITNGKQYGVSTVSSAANAYLVRRGDTLSIDQTAPVGPVAFALQTGPYILPAVIPTIASDEHARRVVIAHTKDNAWYFLAFTNPESAYEGPLLSEIPALVQKLPQTFVEALNLDGGTASAFYNEDGARFGELTTVGSFLCGSK
jgi:hypothetical protein